MRIRISRPARADLRRVREWYRDESPGLDREFVSSIDEALAQIERFPRAAPLVYRGARRMLLRRFPYMLFYRVTNGEIVVVGCFHMARDPMSWRGRLDRE